MKLLRGVMGKLKATGKAGMEKLLEFLEGIKKYLGLGDEVTDIAKIENLADSRPDFARHVDEATELEAKRKADLEYKDKTDSQADEKAKVFSEAYVRIKIADKINLPIQILITNLNLLAARNPKANATFKFAPNLIGPGHYIIRMNPIMTHDYFESLPDYSPLDQITDFKLGKNDSSELLNIKGLKQEWRTKQRTDGTDYFKTGYVENDIDLFEIFEIYKKQLNNQTKLDKDLDGEWVEGFLSTGEKMRLEWQPIGHSYLGEGPHTKIVDYIVSKNKAGKSKNIQRIRFVVKKQGQ